MSKRFDELPPGHYRVMVKKRAVYAVGDEDHLTETDLVDRCIDDGIAEVADWEVEPK